MKISVSVPIISRVLLDEPLSLWEDLLLRLLLILVQLLLGAHTLNHIDHVDRGHVNLLLLGGQGSLRRLESLLLALLLLGSLLWVLSHSTVVSVSEEDGLLVGWLVCHLGLRVLFDEDAVDGLVDSLGGSLLEVLLLAVSLEVEDILEHGVGTTLALSLLGLLDFDIVASVLNIWNDPIVDFISPLSSPLDTHVLVRRDELVDDQVLHSDFPSKLPDTIHQVLSLTMDDLLHVFQFT